MSTDWWIRVIANGTTISLIDGRMKVPVGRSERLQALMKLSDARVHWVPGRSVAIVVSRAIFFAAAFMILPTSLSHRGNVIRAMARLILLLLRKAAHGIVISFARSLMLVVNGNY